MIATATLSGGPNQESIEQKKQAEVSSDGALEWSRWPGARAAAPRRAARASSSMRELADPKRAESGEKQACAVAILSALNENAVELSEAGFVEGREQFGRKAVLKKSKTNKESGNTTHCDSELRLKHEDWTSTERLLIEGADGGGCCPRLCESGGHVMRARRNLECSRTAVLARVNARWQFGHAGSQLVNKPEKISSNAVFGRQNGKRGSMKTGSHQRRECSIRLVEGVKQILRLGGGSRVGGPLLSGLKSVVIPSSVEVLCRSDITKCSFVESVIFETGSKLRRIEESTFSASGLKSIVIPSSVEMLCESCFSGCKSLSSITFESDSHLQRIEGFAFKESGLKSIVIPSSVEVLCTACFSGCKSLSSVTFETCSKLVQIESRAFHGCSAFLSTSECVLRKSRTLVNCKLVPPHD
jgi:hypothetical protein